MTTPFDDRLDAATDECLDEIGKAVIGLKTLKNAGKGEISSLKFAALAAKTLSDVCGVALARLINKILQAVN